MGLLWEMYQSGTIAGARRRAAEGVSKAGEAASKAATAQRDVKYLEDRLDKLTLVCLAMWSLIREKTGLTEEDLVQHVTEIDLADGQADGKAAKRVAKCPKCDRVMATRHKHCMYCGHDKLDMTAFDSAL